MCVREGGAFRHCRLHDMPYWAGGAEEEGDLTQDYSVETEDEQEVEKRRRGGVIDKIEKTVRSTFSGGAGFRCLIA